MPPLVAGRWRGRQRRFGGGACGASRRGAARSRPVRAHGADAAQPARGPWTEAAAPVWLLIPWYLVLAARFFLLPGSWRRLGADEEQAVQLYRRLSGKDPRVARAEVGRIVLQLGALDERLRLDEERAGAPRGADPDEVEAAAGALVGYYLAGRRTDDELLSEVEAAWASYEELTEQQLERAMGGKRVGRRRAGPMADERIQAAADTTARRGGAGLIAGSRTAR